jgi:hypothetical protein
MTDFTTNPGPPPTAEAPREPTPIMDYCNCSVAPSQRNPKHWHSEAEVEDDTLAEAERIAGELECSSAPIKQLGSRMLRQLVRMVRRRPASPSLGELGTLDGDVVFLLNYAGALRSSAERKRAEGQVFGPECVDVQAPIFDRIAARLSALVAERDAWREWAGQHWRYVANHGGPPRAAAHPPEGSHGR